MCQRICVSMYPCVCVSVYLCIRVSVYLCICLSSIHRLTYLCIRMYPYILVSINVSVSGGIRVYNISAYLCIRLLFSRKHSFIVDPQSCSFMTVSNHPTGADIHFISLFIQHLYSALFTKKGALTRYLSFERNAFKVFWKAVVFALVCMGYVCDVCLLFYYCIYWTSSLLIKTIYSYKRSKY